MKLKFTTTDLSLDDVEVQIEVEARGRLVRDRVRIVAGNGRIMRSQHDEYRIDGLATFGVCAIILAIVLSIVAAIR